MARVTTELRWLQPGYIEEKAQRRLAAYERQYGKIVKPPIPVNHLVEAHLGLVIDWGSIQERAGETILAYLEPADRRIRMNEARRSHFDRFFGTEHFTLGHEVGHWDLHVVETDVVQLSLLDEDRTGRFICRGNQSNSLEWQANRYAAALLMPETMIQEYAEMVDLFSWPDLYCLKDLFSVTITALTRRLRELGMVYVSPANELYPNREVYTGQSDLF